MIDLSKSLQITYILHSYQFYFLIKWD